MLKYDDKALNEFSKEELIEALNSKKELDSYFLLNRVYEINKENSTYYSYFDEFLKMIEGKTSFSRMRGVGLCSSLAKWDKDNKIDQNLEKILSLLKDEKPTTVRVTITCLIDILKVKPYLSKEIENGLKEIDLSKYKESMSHLIEKDVIHIKNVINEL